jgi:membrane associated rhomboid family serine protease
MTSFVGSTFHVPIAQSSALLRTEFIAPLFSRRTSVWDGQRPVRFLRTRSSGGRSEKQIRAVNEQASQSTIESNGTGTLFLCSVNVAVYFLDHVLRVPFVSNLLYLHHAAPRFWQLFTALFAHGSFAHLRGNLFFLLTFGRYLEDVWGSAAVISTYLICGACANAMSLLLLGTGGSVPIVSLGASGAVFALFTLSVLCRLQPRFGRLVECCILCSYVGEQIRDEVRRAIQAAGASGARKGVSVLKVNHVAHLSGALVGVFVMLILRAVRRATRDSDDTQENK